MTTQSEQTKFVRKKEKIELAKNENNKIRQEMTYFQINRMLFPCNINFYKQLYSGYQVKPDKKTEFYKKNVKKFLTFDEVFRIIILALRKYTK